MTNMLKFFDEKELTDCGIILEDIINYAVDGWNLGVTHGLKHWLRVERNGLLLAEAGNVNRKVVRLFAILHDHKRFNDWMDSDHGQRAADALMGIRNTLLKGLNEEEFSLLYRACSIHTHVNRTGEPTIDACLDADKLELLRCGIRPDPNRMATELGVFYAKQLRFDENYLDQLCEARERKA